MQTCTCNCPLVACKIEEEYPDPLEQHLSRGAVEEYFLPRILHCNSFLYEINELSVNQFYQLCGLLVTYLAHAFSSNNILYRPISIWNELESYWLLKSKIPLGQFWVFLIICAIRKLWKHVNYMVFFKISIRFDDEVVHSLLSLYVNYCMQNWIHNCSHLWMYG